MRMMEWIRQKGSAWLIGFLVFFLVSVFAGLGVGAFNFGSGPGSSDRDSGLPSRPTLITESNAVFTVNGVGVEQERFNDYVAQVLSNARQSMSDPSFIMDVYAFATEKLIQEEVLSQKGISLGVEVTSEDIAEAKNNAIASLLTIDDGSSGNILGDLTKGLGTSRERKAAFNEHLNRLGVTEKQWKSRVSREILLGNTTDHMQEVADSAALLKAEETKVLVDEALIAGEVFQDVVREYSDDPNAERGGDVGTWIKRGLLGKDIEDVIYTLEKGETSDWFEVGVGFQKFRVYARKETTDPEFEDARQGVIDRLMEGKEEGYEPTEEEIAEEYLEIKYYYLQLNTSDYNAAYAEITELMENADVEINDPFILAHQALNGDKLQPPAGWSLADLEEFARNTQFGEGYEFSLIADKLAVGNGETKATDAEEADEADDSSEEDEDSTPDTPEIPGLEDAPVNYPIYALGVGLLQHALELQGEDGSVETNYLIAKTYMDWLGDEEQESAQPLNRTGAREAVEANLERAVVRYNYSAIVYAQRGLNLAWLDNVDAAKEQLAFAEEYAPQKSGGVWVQIREAYEVLDDQDAMDSIDTRETEWRQAELRAQIERQQAASTQGQQPITFDFDAFKEATEGADDAEEDGSTEESAEEATDDTDDTDE